MSKSEVWVSCSLLNFSVCTLDLSWTSNFEVKRNHNHKAKMSSQLFGTVKRSAWRDASSRLVYASTSASSASSAATLSATMPLAQGTMIENKTNRRQSARAPSNKPANLGKKLGLPSLAPVGLPGGGSVKHAHNRAIQTGVDDQRGRFRTKLSGLSMIYRR